MAGQSRFFLTEKSKIASNIESGVINESDFIITSDTHELYFVKEDGTYFAITTVQNPSGEGGYVRGNSTGTTRNHVAVWGDNGFEIKDSGYTIASNVPVNAKFTDTTYSPATTLLSGLMSKDDKTKLDGINVDAIKTQLQSLYVKLGGDSNETASSIENWIDKIENVAGTGSGSGGNGVKVIDTLNKMDQSNGVYLEAQITAGELISYTNAGNVVYLKCTFTDEGATTTEYLLVQKVDYVNNQENHSYSITASNIGAVVFTAMGENFEDVLAFYGKGGQI